jgi:chondroitin AC lyase
MDSQGMAMLKMNSDRIQELSISDPSRKLGRIMVTVSGIYNSKGEDFITIPDHNQNNTLILVELPQGAYAGKSINIKL